MQHNKPKRFTGASFSIAGVLAICLGTVWATSVCAQTPAASTASQKAYVATSVRALPDLQCKLHIPGTEPTSDLLVRTDEDGYARFYAVQATADDAVRQLFLDCTDPAGKTSSYPVDLTSADTFIPRPVNLANERGTDRPALTGDPLGYAQADLIRANYGLRPDPAKDPAAYARWLASANKPGRLLEAKRIDSHFHIVTETPGGPWVGSVLRGSPNYISTEATFNVPKGIPGKTTSISIWNGLGGFGFPAGLIQGGVFVNTTPTTAIYGSFREYCCGASDTFRANFVPNPGDQIYSQEWYCDSSGNLDINGGYGCSFLHDLTTGEITSCTSSTGSPCWSVKALPGWTVGTTAEFIIENESPQMTPASDAFTDFTPIVTISGSAYSSTTGSYSQTVSTDRTVDLLIDYPRTDTTTHMDVSIGTSDQTNFVFCSGPGNACGGCSSLPDPPGGNCQSVSRECGVLVCEQRGWLCGEVWVGCGECLRRLLYADRVSRWGL
jgi:hypothetical protein